MIKKSMSPPPSRIAAPAAARSSYSFTPGRARATIACIALRHRTPALRTQSSSSALWIESSSCKNPRVNTRSASGRFSRRTLYWFTGIVRVSSINLHKADSAALEFQFADALDHNVGVAAVATMTDIFDGDFDLPAHGFGVCATHGIDQRRIPFGWNDYVARKRVPFPVAGEP